MHILSIANKLHRDSHGQVVPVCISPSRAQCSLLKENSCQDLLVLSYSNNSSVQPVNFFSPKRRGDNDVYKCPIIKDVMLLNLFMSLHICYTYHPAVSCCLCLAVHLKQFQFSDLILLICWLVWLPLCEASPASLVANTVLLGVHFC